MDAVRRSFRNEGHWELVRKKLRKGDYVFIQFGHNDQKADTARHSDAETDYKINLGKYIDETRKVGRYRYFLRLLSVESLIRTVH